MGHKFSLPEDIKDKYRVRTDKPVHHIARMGVNVDLRKIAADDAQRLSLMHPELLERVIPKEVKATVPPAEKKAETPPAEKK